MATASGTSGPQSTGAQELRDLSSEQRGKWVAAISDDEAEAVLHDWEFCQCKANQDLDPRSPEALDQLGAVYAAKGMDSEAASAHLRSHELLGASPAMIAALQAGQRESGLKGFWTAWLKFRRASIAAGKEDPIAVACIYSRAGDTDKALIWLERSFKARRTWIIYLGVDPTFDSLRSDPRFASLLRRIGLPQSQTSN